MIYAKVLFALFIIIVVVAPVWVMFRIVHSKKRKLGLDVRSKPKTPDETEENDKTEEKGEGKHWYSFLTTQQWVDIENLLLFIGNLIFAAACYLLLPGFLRQHWLYSWSHSALLVVVSVILLIIGVFYYFYDPKGPSSRKKSYILLNTVSVIFYLLISWHDVTFFDPAGKALAKVNKGVVSEVLFTDASRSPITGRELRDITSDDVPQAQRFVTTGADIVRWIPLVGKHVSPPPPPPLLTEIGYTLLPVAGVVWGGKISINSVPSDLPLWWADKGSRKLGDRVHAGIGGRPIGGYPLFVWVRNEDVSKLSSTRSTQLGIQINPNGVIIASNGLKEVMYSTY